MNYQFPDISDINTVLDAIEGRPEFYCTLKEYHEKNVGVMNYFVIGYHYTDENTFNPDDPLLPILAECRGLIYNHKGELISRPYHKFFNLNEKSFTMIDSINFKVKSPLIMEKLDGSMIRAIPFDNDNGFVFATKAGITDVSREVDHWLNNECENKSEYVKYIRSSFLNELTMIFEWVSPKNRIVVKYDKPNLLLTGIRDNKNGGYLSRLYINRHESIIPWCKLYLTADYHDFITNLKTRISNDGEMHEGVVLRFNDGHMLKCKTQEYIDLHRVMSNATSEKFVSKLILEDKLDDVVPIIPADVRSAMTAYQSSIHSNLQKSSKSFVETYLNIVDELGEDVDRKTFAIHVTNMNKSAKIKISWIMFALYSADVDLGISQEEKLVQYCFEYIHNHIKKCGYVSDENRWLLNSIRYEDYLSV